MDKRKFEQILKEHRVKDLYPGSVGVIYNSKPISCPDCPNVVSGRVVNYIKKITERSEYWTKRCQTCKTTLTRTDQIDRDFLDLKNTTDK